MQLSLNFTDDTYATVTGIEMKYHYLGVLEACPGAFTREAKYRELPFIASHIKDIESGKVKGRYCLEPELMDELDLWEGHAHEMFRSRCGKCIKEYDVNIGLAISQKEGEYTVTLELFLSSKELVSTPIGELLQNAVSKLRFGEIKKYCIFTDWDNVAS